jgi:hypothetical protein
MELLIYISGTRHPVALKYRLTAAARPPVGRRGSSTRRGGGGGGTG